ncbi:ABC transporter substrate-binding protein [Persicitalea sp.]|uniref:ABC transporter substrate-binding protein n=1 Tax=Persicitalea sp. TaxID=3100273 RepID=UPI003594689D
MKVLPKIIISVEESDSSLGFYETSGKEIARIKTGFWPHEIAVSQDETTAYVTNFGVKDYDETIGVPGSSISVIDIRNACEIKRLYTYTNAREYENFKAPHGVKLSPDGKSLYVNVEGTDEEMLIFNLESQDPFPQSSFKLALGTEPKGVTYNSRHFDIQDGTHNFIFSADGRYLFISAGRFGLFKLNAVTGEVVKKILEDPQSPVRGLTYNIHGTFLIVSGKGKISFVDPETFEVIREIKELNVSQLLYAQPTPDGRYILAPAVWESVVLVIDVLTGKVVKRIITGIDPIHIVFDEAASTAYVSHGRSNFILSIDLNTFTINGKIETKGGPNGMVLVSSHPIPAKKTITFGACLPLSGPTATEGREIRLGYQFWQEKTNEAGGILIGGAAFLVNLVIRDTESRSLGAGDQEFIQSLTEELILHEKVDYLLGSYPTPPNLYMAEVAQRYRIPMVTATGAGEVIYTKGYEYIHGIMSPARVYLSGTIEVLLTEHADHPPSSIFFLSCDDQAAREDAIKTAEFAKNRGLRLIEIKEVNNCTRLSEGVYVYPHNLIQFDEIIAAVKVALPDLFFNTGHLAESQSILQSIIEADFAPKGLAFSVGPSIPAFRNTFGDQSKFLFGSAQWNEHTSLIGYDEFETPANFADRFLKRFSMPASYFSAGGYACGIVFRQALIAARTTDRESVNNILKQTDLETFFGSIKLDHRGLNDSKPIITVQIQDLPTKPNSEVPIYPKNLSGKFKSVYPFPGWQRTTYSSDN